LKQPSSRGIPRAASLGQRFAIDHPERAHPGACVLFIGSPATLRGHPGLQEAWDSTISKLTHPVDPGFVRQIQKSMLAQPVPEAFFESLVQEALKVPARVWRAAFKSLLEHDLSAELDKIKASTLIIWGDRDATVSRSAQEALAAGIVGSRLVVYAAPDIRPTGRNPTGCLRSRGLCQKPRQLRSEGLVLRREAAVARKSKLPRQSGHYLGLSKLIRASPRS